MISTSHHPGGVSGELILEILRSLSDLRDSSMTGLEWECRESLYKAARSYFLRKGAR